MVLLSHHIKKIECYFSLKAESYSSLAQWDNATQETLNAVETIYMVGGNEKPVERAILLSGQTRFDTAQVVLNFIKQKG